MYVRTIYSCTVRATLRLLLNGITVVGTAQQHSLEGDEPGRSHIHIRTQLNLVLRQHVPSWLQLALLRLDIIREAFAGQ